MANHIEIRDGESIMAFTARRIRAEILEKAAKDLERNVMGMTKFNSAFRMGYSWAAHALRTMAEE